MGEVCHYHITMLVCNEQEEAIRTLFKDNNWTCWLNVLSDQTVTDIRTCGYDYIFSDDINYHEKGIVKSEYIEIKSEVVNVDHETDTDSAEETDQVAYESPTSPPSDYMVTKESGIPVKDNEVQNSVGTPIDADQAGKMSGPPLGDNEVPRTSGLPLRNNEVPRTSGLPLGDNEVPRTSGLPLGDNEVPRMSELPLRDYEVPRTSGVPLRDNEVPRTSGLPLKDTEVPRTSGLPLGDNEVPRMSGLPLRDYEVPRTSGLPLGDNEVPRKSGLPLKDNEIPRTSGLPLGYNEVPRTSELPLRYNEVARTSGLPLRDNEVPKTSGLPLGDNEVHVPKTSGNPRVHVPKTSGVYTADYAVTTASGIPSANYMVPVRPVFGSTNFMMNKTQGFPITNFTVPTGSRIFPVNCVVLKPSMVPSTANVTTGIPASGYASDLVTSDKSTPQQTRSRPMRKSTNCKYNVRDESETVTSTEDNKEDNYEEDTEEDEIEQKKSNPRKRPYTGSFNFLFCSDCPAKCITYEQLWEHRDEAKHKLPKKRPVGQMKRKFSPEELVKMGFTKCSECSSYFPTQRKLRQHLYSNHREIMPTPSCPVCAEEFESFKDLNTHKREKQHNCSVWRLNSYQCETCGKHLTKYENFKRHKLLSCGKSDKELEELRVHPCEVCGKRFMTLGAVKHHTSVVHETMESVCDICGKVCKSKFSLRGHKLRHNEQNRKYKCEECGKGFFTSTILKQHIRCHTKEKPFKCPLCDYTCSVPGNINKHARNVHKQQVLPVCLIESKQ